jgi:hypothetical protein
MRQRVLDFRRGIEEGKRTSVAGPRNDAKAGVQGLKYPSVEHEGTG